MSCSQICHEERDEVEFSSPTGDTAGRVLTLDTIGDLLYSPSVSSAQPEVKKIDILADWITSSAAWNDLRFAHTWLGRWKLLSHRHRQCGRRTFARRERSLCGLHWKVANGPQRVGVSDGCMAKRDALWFCQGAVIQTQRNNQGSDGGHAVAMAWSLAFPQQ